jgi:hypothetical protein
MEQLKNAIETLDEIVNELALGEIDYEEAGRKLHAYAGYESIVAMKKALEQLGEEPAPLYVLGNVEEGRVTSYPKGGGSSTPARIKAHDSLASARRSKGRHSGQILKVTAVEVVE